MDQYVLIAIGLALIGFALIASELFIPSGGMISILSATAFVVSMWFAYRGWWEESPTYFWTFASSLFVGIPLFILGLFRLLETTRLGDRILLSAPTPEEVTPYKEEELRLTKLIGRRGRALSMLNPGGLVRVDGERLHAFSEGLVIDPDEWVEVMEVRGSRVLVRPTTAPPPETDSADELAAKSETDPPEGLPPTLPPAQLDFDLS